MRKNITVFSWALRCVLSPLFFIPRLLTNASDFWSVVFRTEVLERGFVMKYIFDCMNAFLSDRVFVLEDDHKAIEIATNYEATCYKINSDGQLQMIYDPSEIVLPEFDTSFLSTYHLLDFESSED